MINCSTIKWSIPTETFNIFMHILHKDFINLFNLYNNKYNIDKSLYIIFYLIFFNNIIKFNYLTFV